MNSSIEKDELVGQSAANVKNRQCSKPESKAENLTASRPNCVITQPKSHKVEGKNKRSLHQKQNQAQTNQSQCSVNKFVTGRPQHKSNNAGPSPSHGKNDESSTSIKAIPTTLDDFSKRAQELKDGIYKALDKQTASQITDQPSEVVKLKEEIFKLSGFSEKDKNESSLQEATKNTEEPRKNVDSQTNTESIIIETEGNQNGLVKAPIDMVDHEDQTTTSQCKINSQAAESSELQSLEKPLTDEQTNHSTYKSDQLLIQAIDKLDLDATNIIKPELDHLAQPVKKPSRSSNNPSGHGGSSSTAQTDDKNSTDGISKSFELLDAKLDSDSKYIALTSSLQRHFKDVPHLLDPICRKLVSMSEQSSQLSMKCDECESENDRLSKVKQKLENLCRELQKSNNAIRIESLDLIKVEQTKAKEQTTKIQSTLSGVIKLFDENQQRNMTLRQENQDLQTKLKSLLDHCDNWEKSVETTLRQRDIENRLLKTELAKANLLKNEEKEKFLGEKQDLLQILSIMQEQQHRIESQEAKLRSDLSSYASKYDECQQVISKGMNRFQVESKKMLKQIEKSKQDYRVLLSKYENNSKKMTQLLEEKQHWDKTVNLANKKIETLERLCRALKERKEPTSQGNTAQNKTEKNKSLTNKDTKVSTKETDTNESSNKPRDALDTEKSDAPVTAKTGDKTHNSLDTQHAKALNNTSSTVSQHIESTIGTMLENAPMSQESADIGGDTVRSTATCNTSTSN